MNKETEIEDDDDDRITDYVRPYEVAKHVALQLTRAADCPTPEKVEEARLAVFASCHTATILAKFLSDSVKHENGELDEEVLMLRDLVAISVAAGCTDAVKLRGKQREVLREVIRETVKAHLNNSLIEILGGDPVDFDEEEYAGQEEPLSSHEAERQPRAAIREDSVSLSLNSEEVRLLQGLLIHANYSASLQEEPMQTQELLWSAREKIQNLRHHSPDGGIGISPSLLSEVQDCVRIAEKLMSRGPEALAWESLRGSRIKTLLELG